MSGKRTWKEWEQQEELEDFIDQTVLTESSDDHTAEAEEAEPEIIQTMSIKKPAKAPNGRKRMRLEDVNHMWQVLSA